MLRQANAAWRTGPGAAWASIASRAGARTVKATVWASIAAPPGSGLAEVAIPTEHTAVTARAATTTAFGPIRSHRTPPRVAPASATRARATSSRPTTPSGVRHTSSR